MRERGEPPSPQDRRPPENPHLLAALHAAAAEPGPATRDRVYEALLAARLLVALKEPEPGEATEVVTFHAARQPSGDASLLTFTDQRALDLWRPQADFAVAWADGLIGYVLESGLDALTVNAAGPVSATLDRRELRALASGETPRPRPGGGASPPVDAGQLTLRPATGSPGEPFLAALRHRLARHDQVAAAFMLEPHPPSKPPRLILGLELAPGVESVSGEIEEDLRRGLAEVAPEGAGLGLTAIRPANVAALRQEGVRPAFERAGGAPDRSP